MDNTLETLTKLKQATIRVGEDLKKHECSIIVPNLDCSFLNRKHRINIKYCRHYNYWMIRHTKHKEECVVNYRMYSVEKVVYYIDYYMDYRKLHRDKEPPEVE